MGDKIWFVAAALAASAVTGCIAETPETTPLIPIPQNGWVWWADDAMKCRDGSTTGFGINRPEVESDKMLYMLEGGSACFNFQTCATNPEFFDEVEFAKYSTESGVWGVFDRTNPLNPFKDWNYVFVPYCTGDAHAGNKPDGSVLGSPQVFVGYENVGIVIEAVQEQFPDITSGILSGDSACGLGVIANYIRLQNAYSTGGFDVPFGFLDDSGPPMNTDVGGITSCLQNQMWSLWGLEDTIGAECGASCTEEDFVLPVTVKAANLAASPGVSMPAGFMDSTQDIVMRTFFAFGGPPCPNWSPFAFPTPVPGPEYEAALDASLKQVALEAPNFRYFVFPGQDHTSIPLPAFYNTTGTGGQDARVSGPVADQTGLPEWTAEFLMGSGAGDSLWPGEIR